MQQILVLPGALKACVLCNGTASFYSLPELSPAFPNREPTGVQWIGGYDENEGRDNPEGTSIMIATAKRILRVQIGDKLRPIRPNIEYPECLKAARRDTIACVADGKSYTLLEIEHQQKIPLFDISTTPEPEQERASHLSSNAAQGHGHSRSKSLGDFSSSPADRTKSPDKSTLSPPAPIDRARSPALNVQHETTGSIQGSRPRSSTAENSPAAASREQSRRQPLRPHVLSPFPNEFMLTTGTQQSEPGVGMFVNLDGDVSRGTIEFDHYPEAVMACTFGEGDTASIGDDANVFIFALLLKPQANGSSRGVQVQSLATDASFPTSKAWLPLPAETAIPGSNHTGLQHCLSVQRYTFAEVADLLQAVRYQPGTASDTKENSNSETELSVEKKVQDDALSTKGITVSASLSPEYDAKRSQEERAFVQRLGHAVTRGLTWSDDQLWQILPNPLLLQLESQISNAMAVDEADFDFQQVNVSQILSFLGSVREREPQDETEFLSIRYARQKASIFLFLHLLAGVKDSSNLRAACKLAESALLESEIDPRIPLSLLHPLSKEVVHGSTGIWLPQGIVECLEGFQSSISDFKQASIEFWMTIRHYLSTWQERRGASGSLSDEKAIFDSVDAALLHLLLHMDSSTARADQVSSRVKLSNVVDHWKGDFDRAVTLLEHFKRLFMLSRLYQSRKSSKHVLQTWKRICDGEENADKDITIEHIYSQMRKYLPLLRDTALVREYSVWLAQRSPDLGVQVLSDDSSRVKFAPAEVVSMLKEHAPSSVQLFLEHLVFTKNLDQYADDLVGYYLDSVLDVLENSEQARQSLADSYTTYRALTSPKPTYFNFIQENAPDEPWWQSRLRLLQLLGTGGYATASGSSKTLTYSIEMVLERLSPFSQYLVSESIILDARQGRHGEALKLLVHGLGDYDTAVRYCYFGGPSSPTGTIDVSLLPPRSQQQEQFIVLFKEFLQIEDEEERLERTSHLLGTFATWFDPLTILDTIPETWSVALLSDFLLRTFRAASTERNQALIIKALSAAQNLQKQAEFINTCEKMGAKLQVGDNTAPSQDENVIPLG